MQPSKLLEVELIWLLEWSLPVTWRAKFDLDGYIPMLHSKARLIEACEAIEQSEISSENSAKEESSQSHKVAKATAAKKTQRKHSAERKKAEKSQ